MPLGLMHGKWDGISMASPPLHSYKHERPAYSTPQPVENTPANNECRMVELRGAKVASFFVGGDEFICLPQAFDLFLKHLVGGLHTVYTKLKRLSISPVVCNVEQVRVLRGLGAIQPGVNRCKLITRKDFEILYQDCTQASRPGRPPKRYPMLPPTNDLMSHHAGMGSLNPHGILSAADLNNLHKRMRLDQDIERNLHQREQERRPSDSPTKDTATLLGKNLAIPGSNEIHASAANLYLQAHQALRQQYQQVASSGMHNGMDSHHRVSPTGMNPALAPLMMMSHPALFSGALPPSMLNHINKFAQDHGTSSVVSNAAAAAAAQIAANGGNMQQQAAAAYQMAAAAQSAAHATLAAAAASASNTSTHDENRPRSSAKDEKTLDNEKRDTPRSHTSTTNISLPEQQNGIDNDILGSPQSSVSSLIEGEMISNGSLSDHSDSMDSFKYRENHAEVSRYTPTTKKDQFYEEQEITNQDDRNEHHENEKMTELDEETGSPNDRFVANDNAQSNVDNGNISSMQTLLTNIQGLLKVAADNARLQEKQSSLEIADLKSRMVQERQIRSVTEKKLQESERIGALIHKRLKKERKVRKLLQEQLRSMQQQIEPKNDESVEKIASAPTMPIRGAFGSGRDASESAPSNEQRSPRRGSPSHTDATSPATSDKARNSSTIPDSSTAYVTRSESSPQTSPLKSEVFEQFTSNHLLTNVNNSNNNHMTNEDNFLQNNDSQMATPPVQFSEDRRESFEHDSDIGAIAGKREFVDRIQIPGARMFFGAAHFQSTVSQ